jgi:phosphonate transport system substrate-binding protein
MQQYFPYKASGLTKSSIANDLRRASFALLPFLTLLGFGCKSQPSESALEQNSQPNHVNSNKNQGKILRVAVIPAQSQGEQQKKIQPLADYLEKSTGYKFEFIVTKDYKTSVDLLVHEKVDLAYLGPFSYVLARQRNQNIEPIVAPIDKNTGRPWYNSVVVANTASGIKSLAGLKGKRFAFVSEKSTSGYLVPMAQFKAEGINPQRDFAAVKYSGSHDQVKTDLAKGIVDAIAVDKPSFLLSQKSGKLNPTQYKIIWESDPIPTVPIVASSKLAPQIIIDLKRVFINSPAGLPDANGAESAGYTLTKDADYEPIRQLQAKLKLEGK